MNSTWKIVFKGEVLPEFTVETAKTNFAHLFKMPLEQVNQLFTGKEFTLKSNVSHEQIPSILNSFKKRGLIVYAINNELSTNDASYANGTNNVIKNEQPQPKTETVHTEINNGFSIQNKEKIFNNQPNINYTYTQNNHSLSTDETNELDDYLESTPPIIGIGTQGRWGRLSFINAFTIGLGVQIFSQILSFVIILIAGIASFKNASSSTNFFSSGLGIGILAFVIITYIVVFIWFIRISILRLHDLNWSGWWSVPIALCFFIPALHMSIFFINLLGYIATFVIFFCMPGTQDENQYGPLPTQGSPVGLIIFGVIGIPYLSMIMFSMMFIAGMSLLSR
ncbi:DUF805 domain-containing protein [Neisseria sp. Ec49-e6-T10]|uniref:DUF805 domain-containing protein n=1 Tax=Neisseria sp. Ec49-e6-T10 TaxID=3140744 RepID=UPI003EBBF171